MDKGVRNTLLWIAGFIALVAGILVAGVVFRAPGDEALRSLGYYRFDEPRVINDFSLVDHDANAVDRQSLQNEWSLLFFGFTYCPDVCPTTLSVLNAAVQEVTQPLQVILVSVDPERDKPDQLARYVKSFNPGFIGYTGDFDEIAQFATNVNVAFGKVPGPELGTYTVEHSASIVVVNPRGQYVGFIKAPHEATNIVAISRSFN